MPRRRLDRLHPYCRIASPWAESSDKGNSIQHFRRKSGTRNGFERRVCLPQRCFCQQTLQVGTGLTSTSPPRCPRRHARSCWAMKPQRLGLGSVLGAVHRSVLNCPQRMQRGLLRLGQAPDPCDIEALVGAVASQRAQMLATLQVPERDGPVIPATSQKPPIGTHLERLHCPLMRFSLPHALPTVHLPPAHPPVTASTVHQLSTESPGQCKDHPRMPFKGVHALPAVGIPHEELPTVAAATTRGQPRPIRTPGHTRDDP